MSRKINRNPLKRITDIYTDDRGVTWELLECGHNVLPRQDIIGTTNAYRRRCRYCGRRAQVIAELNAPSPPC